MDAGYQQISQWKRQCDELVRQGYQKYNPTLNEENKLGAFSVLGLKFQSIEALKNGFTRFCLAADKMASGVLGMDARLLAKRKVELASDNPDPEMYKLEAGIADQYFDNAEAVTSVVDQFPGITLEDLALELDEVLNTPGAQVLGATAKLEAYFNKLCDPAHQTSLTTNNGKREFRSLLNDIYSRIGNTFTLARHQGPMTTYDEEVKRLHMQEKALMYILENMNDSRRQAFREDEVLKTHFQTMKGEVITYLGALRETMGSKIHQCKAPNIPKAGVPAPEYKAEATAQLLEAFKDEQHINWPMALEAIQTGADPFAYKGPKLRPNILFAFTRDITNNPALKGQADPHLHERTECLKLVLQQPGAVTAMCSVDESYFGNTPFTAAIAARDKEVSDIMLEYLSHTPKLRHITTTGNTKTMENYFGHHTPMVLALKTNNEALALKLLPFYSAAKLRECCTWAGHSALQLAHVGRFEKLLPEMAKQAGPFPPQEAMQLQQIYQSERDDHTRVGRRFHEANLWHDLYHNDMFLDDKGDFTEGSRPGTDQYDPAQFIDQTYTQPVSATTPASTPGFANHTGVNCFANAALKQIIIGLSPADLEQIKEAKNGKPQEQVVVMDSFLALAEAVIAARNGRSSTANIDKLHRSLFDSVTHYAKTSRSIIAQTLSSQFVKGAGQQQDSQEFAARMVEILGLTNTSQELRRFEITNSLEDEHHRTRPTNTETYYPIQLTKHTPLPAYFEPGYEVMEGREK